MLDEIINAAFIPLYLVSTAILLFATYRALAIGRVLVSGAYRTRALWTAGTMVALVLFSSASALPSANPLVNVAFLLIFPVLFLFVDSSIRVAQDTDFFHRSPLRWGRVRKPLYVVFFFFIFLGAYGTFFLPTNSQVYNVASVLWFAVGAGVVVYGAAALLVGARRTPDRSMRSFVRTLGLAIGCMALFFTVWIPFQSFSVTVQDLGNLIAEFFIPAAAYFLYQAVMLLSPLGRVEKEVDGNIRPL
jgi:hypothetical protein